jgi:predicted transcriptional regulator
MAIIKAPPKQPKSVTVQARVEESVKEQLELYAKFIDSTPSYVITEALKVLFKRDDEFKAWLGQQSSNGKTLELTGGGLKETA